MSQRYDGRLCCKDKPRMWRKSALKRCAKDVQNCGGRLCQKDVAVLACKRIVFFIFLLHFFFSTIGTEPFRHDISWTTNIQFYSHTCMHILCKKTFIFSSIKVRTHKHDFVIQWFLKSHTVIFAVCLINEMATDCVQKYLIDLVKTTCRFLKRNSQYFTRCIFKHFSCIQVANLMFN